MGGLGAPRGDPLPEARGPLSRSRDFTGGSSESRQSFLSPAAGQTFAFGRALGEALRKSAGGALLALCGELGSGKTTFTKGLAAGLGVRDHSRVSSPTFVLRQDYLGEKPIHHYDAYRLSGPREFLALGFEESLEGGAVTVVEWADRVEEAMPPGALRLEFEHVSAGDGDSGVRRITCLGNPALREVALREAERLSLFRPGPSPLPPGAGPAVP